VIDVAPTIFDLLEIEKPPMWNGQPIPPAPGHSLVDAFGADVTIDRQSIWWLHEGNRAIRVGDWKLVSAKNERWELYDLRTDRAESQDLAASQPDKVKELESMWNEQLHELSER
jgi:arylsulfatase